jgi:S1-C subfamily serine protease
MRVRDLVLWLGIISATIAVPLGLVYAVAPAKKPARLASATLFLKISENSHGSGVHIGRGYVLTAAHVADHPVTAIDTNGVSHDTEVLWVNTKYDLALLRIDGKGVASRELSCRYLDQGEPLSFEGNPLDIGYTTTYGLLAQSEIKASEPEWAEANIVSAPMVPGMSGGPTYDRHGYLVGINVGTMRGFGLGIIVPGRTICKLMVR